MTASGLATYTYDANGNQTARVGVLPAAYSYDALNRLTGVTGTAVASYAYNGVGLRVSKTVTGTTTNYR